VGGILVYHVDRENHRRVSVPDLTGYDNVSAALILDRVGLAPGYVRLEKASATVPAGHVIRTDPPAGTRVKHGSTMRVIFSCGRPQPGFCNPYRSESIARLHWALAPRTISRRHARPQVLVAHS
jgi:PASTA domain